METVPRYQKNLRRPAPIECGQQRPILLRFPAQLRTEWDVRSRPIIGPEAPGRDGLFGGFAGFGMELRTGNVAL